MPAGGKVNSTWEKGKKPPVSRQKGTKNRRTVLKESIGLTGWERLTEFIVKDGADLYIQKIKRLKPAQYSIAYASILEFIKPKLARQELTGEITVRKKIIKYTAPSE